MSEDKSKSSPKDITSQIQCGGSGSGDTLVHHRCGVCDAFDGRCLHGGIDVYGETVLLFPDPVWSLKISRRAVPDCEVHKIRNMQGKE